MLKSLKKSKKVVTISMKKSTNGLELSTTSTTMSIPSIPTMSNYINYSLTPSNTPEEDKTSSPTSTGNQITPSDASTPEKYSAIIPETC